MGITLCRHCQNKKANRSRGLCWSCYYTKGVRNLYPMLSKNPHPSYEPTAEEVERIVAEQMATIPDCKWWPKGVRRVEGGKND